MAERLECHQEMRIAGSCTETAMFHHPGCDMERCPRCGDQALGCECQDGEEGEDDE